LRPQALRPQLKRDPLGRNRVLSFTLDVYRLNPWLAPVIIGVTATAALLLTRRARRKGTSARFWLAAVITLGVLVLLFLPYSLLWATCIFTGNCL